MVGYAVRTVQLLFRASPSLLPGQPRTQQSNSAQPTAHRDTRPAQPGARSWRASGQAGLAPTQLCPHTPSASPRGCPCDHRLAPHQGPNSSGGLVSLDFCQHLLCPAPCVPRPAPRALLPACHSLRFWRYCLAWGHSRPGPALEFSWHPFLLIC